MKNIYQYILPAVFFVMLFMIQGLQIIKAQELAKPEQVTLPFQYLLGDWQGEGWHDHGNGRVNEFEQTYTFVSLAEGQVVAAATRALLLPEKERVLFDGTVLYSMENKQEKRVSRKVIRRGAIGMETSVEWEENRLFWTQRGGTETWEFELLENGQLTQRGFYTDNGHKFFELILERQ